MDPILKGILAPFIQQAGQAVTEAPEVRAAVASAQAQLDTLRAVSYVGGAMAVYVFLTYFVPRSRLPWNFKP